MECNCDYAQLAALSKMVTKMVGYDIICINMKCPKHGIPLLGDQEVQGVKATTVWVDEMAKVPDELTHAERAEEAMYGGMIDISDRF